VQIDADPVRVELAYRREKNVGDGRVLPLWSGLHRSGRPRADLALVFSRVQEFRSQAGPPFREVARCLKPLSRLLLAEYVPPAPPAAAESRESFPALLSGFDPDFHVCRIVTIPGTRRQLVLFRSLE